METQKPTPEELFSYFKNNRKYFDDLAKYYYENDIQFYKDTIAPIYVTSQNQGQPLQKTQFVQNKKAKNRNSKKIIMISLAIIFGVFLVAGIISNIKKDSGTNHVVKSNVEKTDFEKGVENYNGKLYTSAINSFEKVGENDSLYEAAQEYITRCNDKLDEQVKLREEEEKQKKLDEKRRTELYNKYNKMFGGSGWLHEKQSKLLSKGFREYKSGYENAPDGSQQIKMYYKKYEYGFYIHVSLQYSYSLEHHYVKVWVEKD